ncbi:MAG: rhodanese-like domain-containing protein [Verrucomicrobiales bacterium]
MKRAFAQAALLLVLSAAAAVLTYIFHPRAPALYLYQEPLGPDEINFPLAHQLEQQGGVLWIDARARSEFEKHHIPGAYLLNEEEWDQLAFEIVDVLSSNNKPIVIYCDAQRCEQSNRIAEKLRDLGNQDVRVLKGGWQAWKNAPK